MENIFRNRIENFWNMIENFWNMIENFRNMIEMFVYECGIEIFFYE